MKEVIILIVIAILALIGIGVLIYLLRPKCDYCGNQCYNKTSQKCVEGQIVDLTKCEGQFVDEITKCCVDNKIVDCEKYCYTIVIQKVKDGMTQEKKISRCNTGETPEVFTVQNGQLTNGNKFMTIKDGKIVITNQPEPNNPWIVFFDEKNEIRLYNKSGYCLESNLTQFILVPCKKDVCGNEVYDKAKLQCCEGNVLRSDCSPQINFDCYEFEIEGTKITHCPNPSQPKESWKFDNGVVKNQNNEYLTFTQNGLTKTKTPDNKWRVFKTDDILALENNGTCLRPTENGFRYFKCEVCNQDQKQCYISNSNKYACYDPSRQRCHESGVYDFPKCGEVYYDDNKLKCCDGVVKEFCNTSCSEEAALKVTNQYNKVLQQSQRIRDNFQYQHNPDQNYEDYTNDTRDILNIFKNNFGISQWQFKNSCDNPNYCMTKDGLRLVDNKEECYKDLCENIPFYIPYDKNTQTCCF